MKKVVLSFLFIIILFVLLVAAGYVFRPKNTDVCIDQINDFHSMETNTIDAMVYGSSHSWLGFDANVFAEKTGLNTYNYSCFWQTFNTTWVFFHDSLEFQKPEVVFIEAGRINHFMGRMDLEGQVYYTRKLKCSKEKLHYIHQCFENDVEQYLSYIFPIIAFHNKWEYTDELFSKRTKTDFISNKGQYRSEGVCSVNDELVGAPVGIDMELTKEIEAINEEEGGEIGQQGINDENIRLMKEITNVCDNEGIRLIWFVIPYVGDYNYDDAMRSFVEENGGEYINLFDHLDDMEFDCQNDFSDGDHLNVNGAAKVSSYLAEYVK